MAYIASYLMVMALAMTVLSAPMVFVSSQEENAGRVLFVERDQQEFLREGHYSNKVEESFSQEDIAAAVSVLLGIPPPLALSSASSAKLDTVLSPNPFRRPRAVLALTIRGINLDLLSAVERETIFGTSTVQQRVSVGNSRQFVLPGNDVDVVSLDKHQEGLKQGLKHVSDFLGGVLAEEDAEVDSDVDGPRGVVVLTVPLAEGVSISLDLSREADRKFVSDLLSLHDILKRAGASQETRSIAKLYIDSVEAMDNNLDASKILLFTAVKVLNGGHIVGVFVFPPSSSVSESQEEMMFLVKSPVRSRALDEDLGDASANADLLKVDSILIELETIALVRKSLVVATSLILLVSILIGTCYLVFMPFTRDTLLYSGAKLD